MTGTRTPLPRLDSQQVAWYPCHEFLAALLAQADSLPTAGTPAWCALADNDPQKLLALAAAGEHMVLRIETDQQNRCEASRAITASHGNYIRENHRITMHRNSSHSYIPRRRNDAD